MPGFDRTGPEGMGPMTGWGRGFCGPHGRRTGRRAFGLGFNRGGRGRGYRHNHWAGEATGWGRGRFRGPHNEPFYVREDEMATLQKEAARLKEELNAVEQRLSELETR